MSSYTQKSSDIDDSKIKQKNKCSQVYETTLL